MSEMEYQSRTSMPEKADNIFTLILIGILLLIIDLVIRFIATGFIIIDLILDSFDFSILMSFVFTICEIGFAIIGVIVLTIGIARLNNYLLNELNTKPFSISIVVLIIGYVLRIILPFIYPAFIPTPYAELILIPIFSSLITIFLVLFFGFSFYNQYFLNKESKIQIGFILIVGYLVIFIVSLVMGLLHILTLNFTYYYLELSFTLVTLLFCIGNFIYLLFTFKNKILPLTKKIGNSGFM